MQAPRHPSGRDRRELEILHRVALTLSASLSFDDVLTALARELVFGVERACECAISIWEPEHDHLVDKTVFTVHGAPTWPEGPVETPLADFGETRKMLRRGTGYLEYRITDPELRAPDREVLDAWGWRSVIELPLVVEGTSVGLIEVADYKSARPWSARDVAFSRTIASQAAMAVRNAQLYEDLQLRADRDSLTDLLNHRAFYDRLESELARTCRSGGWLAVVEIDLDDFKSLNDSRGHLAGDATLRDVAAALTTTSREGDVIGRLGGDEFAFILPGTDAVQAQFMWRRILAALLSGPGVSASAGVTVSSPGEFDPLTVMGRADASLLAAKQSGKQTLRLSA
jgi:diguanylate cyclase (GGDEF)-like protein